MANGYPVTVGHTHHGSTTTPVESTGSLPALMGCGKQGVFGLGEWGVRGQGVGPVGKAVGVLGEAEDGIDVWAMGGRAPLLLQARTTLEIRRLVARASGSLGGVLVLLCALSANAQTTRVSVATGGGQATGGPSGEYSVALSGDGRYVAFDSDAATLVGSDTNGVADVFVHDRLQGVITRVSVATGGGQASGGGSGTSGISLSGDGRYVAFDSSATNLVSGDTNGIPDVFVHDRETRETTRVSVATGGGQGIGSGARSVSPAMTADGRFVAFHSDVPNLVTGDTNLKPDVFLHDRLTVTTWRVSVADGGVEAVNASVGSIRPSVSADGRYVAFNSDAENLVPGDTNSYLDAFVHDRDTGTTTRVSVRSDGGQARFADSFYSMISADGRYVAFDSEADNLVPGDTNAERDVFVHDRTTASTTRVSLTSAGIEANGQFGSRSPSISADGRFIVFGSDASDLVPGDTNGASDIFLHDRSTGKTTRLSVSSAGSQATSFSYRAKLSADGRFAAFGSNAPNLVPGDSNGQPDVFVRDTRMFERRRVTVTSSGQQLNGAVIGRPSVSGNGRFVAFASGASGVVADDTNVGADVFVHDLASGATTRASVATGGVEGGGGSVNPSVSGDGQVIAFESAASGLVPGDNNNQRDVFVHDRSTSQTTRVSVSGDGAQARGRSVLPAISEDGQTVAFVSNAWNLVDDDDNGSWDVFVHDRSSGMTTRVSVATGGRQAVGSGPPRTPPSLSADGRLVAFDSEAPNLVQGDTNDQSDVFVHDTATGATTSVSLRAGRPGATRVSASLSGNGRYVAFVAEGPAQWLVLPNTGRAVFMHDRSTGRTTRVSPYGADAPAVSRDGLFVAFDRPLSAAPSSRRDVFVLDGTRRVTTRGSLGDYATPNGSSYAAALSADARVLAYRSSATNLVDDDTNGVADVFVRVTTPVVRSVTPRGGPTAGGTTLTIDGEGFTAATTVSIGGVPAGPITFIDSTRLAVDTPPHVAGLVDVVVTVPGFGAERLAWAFTYQ